MKTEKIKAYKAFDKDFRCRDFQYEVGQTYHHKGTVELCESGFHACTNPLDVLNYYDLTTCRFAEVELWGCTKETRDDSKRVGAHIKIIRELTLSEFIDVVNVVLAEPGDDAKLAASGDYSQLAASGYNSKLAASGYNPKLAASGNNSKLAASGDSSKLASSGYRSKLAASGNYSKLAITGEHSVGANIGCEGKIKGIVGTWITLAEYVDGVCSCVKSAKIDGKKLKADTWYQLINGKFTEVKD